MTSLNKSFNRRVGSLFAVAALVLATVTPGLIPAFASAAQLTERTVELSSSSKAAQSVQYKVNFNAITAAGAVVLDFCQNSPLIGTACTDPAGFSAASAATPTTDFTIAQTTAAGDDAVVLTGDITGAVEFTVTGITNPTASGPLYVRMVTFDTETNALAYTSTAPGSDEVVIDEGSAAVSITDTVGVSGAVLEAMTFCVSGAAITTTNCGSVTAPTVSLAETNGALSSTAVSEGSIYSQISTNAAGGAVVNLKSSALACGGLVRAGAPTSCDIAPALATGIANGDAKFGAKVVAATDPAAGASSNGTFRAYGDTPYYSDSVFKLNYVEGDGTGITSPYGDPLLDTDDGPASNKNIQITFGASVANNTPAGLYSADLSLIATGKF